MIRRTHIIYFLLSALTLLLSCTRERQVQTSFYYWKTAFSLTSIEEDALRHLHVNRLFVRIMDVDWSTERSEPVPVSPVVFKQAIPDSIALVPVVFIVNNALTFLDKPAIQTLAARIVSYTSAKAAQAGKKKLSEIQIDCDWTKSTKANYFALLEEIKKKKPAWKLSVTLRLHQFKNRSTGIPPADATVLMLYNMGNLRKSGNQNSILELNEMKKYLSDESGAYPLPTDVALPLFSWTVAFRNNEYLGIARVSAADLNKGSTFRKRPGTRLYEVLEDLPQAGLRKKDLLRNESVPADTVSAAAQLIKKHLTSHDSLRVLYYHLDQQLLKTFPDEKLEEISHLFN